MKRQEVHVDTLSLGQVGQSLVNKLYIIFSIGILHGFEVTDVPVYYPGFLRRPRRRFY